MRVSYHLSISINCPKKHTSLRLNARIIRFLSVSYNVIVLVYTCTYYVGVNTKTFYFYLKLVNSFVTTKCTVFKRTSRYNKYKLLLNRYAVSYFGLKCPLNVFKYGLSRLLLLTFTCLSIQNKHKYSISVCYLYYECRYFFANNNMSR